MVRFSYKCVWQLGAYTKTQRREFVTVMKISGALLYNIRIICTLSGVLLDNIRIIFTLLIQ